MSYRPRVYEPDAEQIERMRETAFRQKQNKYTPLINVDARNFVEAQPMNNKPRSGVTFGGVGIEDQQQTIEVSENPVYLQNLQNDAMYTNAGQPFHPVYPGSTKTLRIAPSSSRQTVTAAATATTSIGERGFRNQPPIGDNNSNNNNYNNTSRRPASSPPGSRNRSSPRTRQQPQTQQQMANSSSNSFSSSSFYHEAVGELRKQDRSMVIDPFARDYDSRMNNDNNYNDADPEIANAHRQLQYQVAKERRERQQQEMEDLAEQQASLHQQHTIRHSCSDAVQIIRALLYFRGVNTNARDGPHNAVTSRFLTLDFLQDVQWLLKKGVQLIRYPSAGAGGAPHIRHFTILMLPWSPGPQEAPVMSPFLVWLNDAKSSHIVGKAPLCNMLGVTKNANDSVIFRRYVSHDAKTIKGPPMSANKKIQLPVEHCASLWFLCYVTGDMMTSNAQSLDGHQGKKVADQQDAGQQRASASPVKRSGVGNLDAETAAARGLIPLNSNTNNNNNTSSSNPASNNKNVPMNQQQQQKLKPGTLGRINVDVAALQYGDILRFVKVMEGLSAVNEVLVKRGK